MYVTVDTSRGNDHVFAGDDFGRRAHHEVGVDTVHRVGIPRLPDPYYAAVPHTDIAFDDTPVIENHRVRNDEIENAAGSRHRAVLPHAIPNHLAAAERNLVAVECEVFFDLDNQGCVGETHTIPRGRTIKVGIRTAVNR